ncbi:MAG: hypothetical protein Q8N77_03590, partial [Nanoarchaeota archaeon]|nr:hypothetical protein [Nanoarchaeota archaeon]
MVYKRYVKRKGKLVGPYYYKTVKNKAGKTRTIYIGRTPPAEPKDESATTSPRYVSSFYSESISKLKKNILLCNAKKELLRLNLERLHLRYQNNEISYSKYELLKNSYLKGKEPEYWYNYYDDYKRNLQDHVDKYLFASSCFGYIQAVSKTGHEANEQLRPKPKLPHAYERKISYLQNNALLCDQRKTRLRKRLQEYSQRYSNRQISYSQYELLRNDYLKGKSPEYWFSYYDEQKLKLEEQISRYKVASVCEKYTAEIFEAKPSLKEKVLTDIVEEELELEEPKFYDKHKSLTQILAVS